MIKIFMVRFSCTKIHTMRAEIFCTLKASVYNIFHVLNFYDSINEFSSKIVNLAGIAPKLLKINSKCFKCHINSVLDEICVEGL